MDLTATSARDRTGEGEGDGVRPPAIRLLTPQKSIPFAQDYLNGAGLDETGDCVAYEDIPDRVELPGGAYVFTGINRLGPAAVEMLGELGDQIQLATGCAPLNHPRRTLRRFELLQALHREGWNDFRAFGAWQDFSNARFPVFVRPREADGGIPVLLHSEKEVVRALGREMLKGWTLHDLLVVEFEDTSDPSGVFRKYSAYIVGSKIVPAPLHMGREWVMRPDQAEWTKDALEEEKRYLEENPHEDQLAAIFSLARTEFGRIDYSLKNGKVQTWEINTLPMFRRSPGNDPVPEAFRSQRASNRDLFLSEYASAWHWVLSSTTQGGPFRPKFGSEVLERARLELSRGAVTEVQDVPFSWLRRWLRPLKQVLKPISDPILPPLLFRWARRGSGR